MSSFQLRGLLVILLSDTRAHDLLFFDEFEFEFNLHDEHDWDEYHIDNLPDDHSPSYHSEGDTINYAKTCTENIPLLFKQLCVHWRSDQGFKYHFKSPPSSYAAHQEDLNWYYDDERHQISDAKVSDRYYSELDQNAMRYLGDDADWNEINYANALSQFTLKDDLNGDSFLENFASGGFKQCRYSMRMRECASFHLPSKTLKVNLQIARARKQRDSMQSAAYSDPKNMHRIKDQTHRIVDYLSSENSAKVQTDDIYEGYDDYDNFGESNGDSEGMNNPVFDFHGECMSRSHCKFAMKFAICFL